MFVVNRDVGRCSVNAPCQDGRSPLHCAVADIDSCGPIAVRLLSLGAEKNKQNSMQWINGYGL